MTVQQCSQVLLCWKSEDEQMEEILLHWRKEQDTDDEDPASLRDKLKDLEFEGQFLWSREYNGEGGMGFGVHLLLNRSFLLGFFFSFGI